MFTDGQTQKPKTASETKNVVEKRQEQISPNVNPNDVKKFLTFVVEGEQEKAEVMLKRNSALTLVPGDIMDLSERIFNNITGFQYAVWALDWHMWTMIRKYLPNAEAKQQAEAFETGSWVKGSLVGNVEAHGVHAEHLLNNLVQALQITIDLCKAKKYDECDEAWIKQVSRAQRLLPAHVVNEYCHPARSFNPTPDFRDTVALPRSRIIPIAEEEWFTILYGKFAYCRGGTSFKYLFQNAYRRGVWLNNRSKGSLNDRIWVNPGWQIVWALGFDRDSIRTLMSTRVTQREELIIELRAKPAQLQSPVTLQSSSNFLISANPFLQSLQMQLKKEETQSTVSSYSHTQTDITIPLATLVHDLEETQKEQQVLEEASQALETQSKRLQEILQKEIAAKKSEYTLLEQQQGIFQKQIASLEQSLSKASRTEQQAIQANLKVLQEQLLVVQTQQAILWNEHEIKAQKREALKRFQSHPNLLLFYRTVHIKLEEVFISFKAVAGGFVNPVDGNVAIAKSIVEAIGDSASIAPIVGPAVEKVLKWSVNKGLSALDSARQKNTAINASGLVTLSEVKKYAESIARQLTERYADQLERLATPEQEESEASKLKQGLAKAKEFALKVPFAPPAKQLAIFGALWIVDELYDAENIDISKELDDVLLSVISQKTPPHRLKEFWQIITSKVGINGVRSKSGEIWHPAAVYTLPGLRVGNEYYSTQKLEPQTYGWRLGTIEEVRALGLQEVAGPGSQSFVLENKKVAESISAVHKNVQQMKQETEQHGARLEKMEKTGDIVGGARLKALQEALDKERKDKEELNQRLGRLERALNTPASAVAQRRQSGILTLTDKKEGEEKVRYILDELMIFFLENRENGEKTENYAIYNECLRKVNNSAKLLYNVKQNKHILYVNGKSIEDTAEAAQEISKMIDSLNVTTAQSTSQLRSVFKMERS